MKHIVKYLISMVVLSTGVSVSADDTSILDTPTTANILFVMDLSGSMGWGKEPNSTPSASDPSRLNILRGAFKSIVSNPKFNDMNFGLSVFSGGEEDDSGRSVAHGISYPVSPLSGDAQAILSKDDYTHPGAPPNNSYMPPAGTKNTSEYLSLLSDSWVVGGTTPIVDALYEAARYFRGEDVYYGKYAPKDIRSAHPSTYNGLPLKEAVIPTPLVCDIACTKGECGPTEANCKEVEFSKQSHTDTGGCTLNPTMGRTCTAVSAGEVAKKCGSKTNCTLKNDTWTRECWPSHTTVAQCLNAYPNYYACAPETKTKTVKDVEGVEHEETFTIIKCKEDVTYYTCDDTPSYSCPGSIEMCTKCPEPSTTVVGEGSAVYKSPIVDNCSNNGIIFLTDGEPTENRSVSKIKEMLGISGECAINDSDGGGDDFDGKGNCAIELARFLATKDQATGATSVPDIEGMQVVNTHTIGLSLDESSKTGAYLKEVANSGGGQFLAADNEEKLTEAFEHLVNQIAGKARSFSAPSYSVDTSTLLSHGDSVYVPVFDKQGVVWPGNLKKFKVSNGVLKDASGNPAIDSNGAILNSAKDEWADPVTTVDSAVTGGGAANKIDPSARLSGKMKTNIGGSLKPLSMADNDDFGLGTTDSEKAALLKYISGSNADGTPRNHMGDIMHSSPVQLEIANTLGGKDKVIFVGTNEGFLHAINDADGTEKFVFMPRELIKNIKPQYLKTAQPNHIYGVDSPITLWIDDRFNTSTTRGNGVLDVADGEKAYLFFGLRRGGKGYYALNVTNPAEPILLWSTNTELSEGNSWSQPVLKMLKRNATSDLEPVLIFGGGYLDDSSGNEIFNKANAVYLVDAKGGPSVWFKKITTTARYSVPSKISVLDIDRNGSIDRLYFGDTGGNIWRVDLDAGKLNATPAPYDLAQAKLHKLASLGGTGVVKRKFFEEPSIALFKSKGKPIITIAIGSGDRPNPLSVDAVDKFFVLYDKEVYFPPSSTTNTLKLDDLTVSTDTFDINNSSFKGWYKDLSTGEKVLSTAITYQSKVLFTTFMGNNTDPDALVSECVQPNKSKLYIMGLNTGVSYGPIPELPSGQIYSTPQVFTPPLATCEAGNCPKPPSMVCPGVCGSSGNTAINLDELVGESGVASKVLERVYWIDNE